jgi:hypothetical protein
MLQAAQTYNENHDLDAAKRFMEANIEIYGAPDRATYDGLVVDLKRTAESKNLTGRATQIKQELVSMLPEVSDDAEAFRPSEETIDWAQNVIEVVNQPFLDLIPDQDQFTPTELKDLFTNILHEGMGGAADNWQVVLSENASSIDVASPERIIRIPDDSQERSQTRVKELVVHEIGVHALRSIMGDGTNVEMLRTGMPGYLDAEEGLGVASEQAIHGKYEDRGVQYYLIAGGQYFHNQNFRDTFEMAWRRQALLNLKDGAELTDEKIAKAKDTAYGQVTRINRGTNDLPWFKDLAYYNGNRKIWDYFSQTTDDFGAVLNLYYGKVDPTDPLHMRAAWDAAPQA